MIDRFNITNNREYESHFAFESIYTIARSAWKPKLRKSRNGNPTAGITCRWI